ncbi:MULTISPECIES: hypothetical protein [unclassified Ruegeria]|uniref:hypothetical protein n=1 Tax=unclassified Ruegeria TaxID=2625375 RepID=UPI001FD7C7C2|nr:MULTISPECIES: hypothetical protein [unclassified Ruegeria]
MNWFLKHHIGRHPTMLFRCLGMLFLALPSPAFAYIGPGAGLGAIAVTIAVLLGVLFLIVGLVWFPLKRLIKKRKESAEQDNELDPSQ